MVLTSEIRSQWKNSLQAILYWQGLAAISLLIKHYLLFHKRLNCYHVCLFITSSSIFMWHFIVPVLEDSTFKYTLHYLSLFGPPLESDLLEAMDHMMDRAQLLKHNTPELKPQTYCSLDEYPSVHS